MKKGFVKREETDGNVGGWAPFKFRASSCAGKLDRQTQVRCMAILRLQ